MLDIFSAFAELATLLDGFIQISTWDSNSKESPTVVPGKARVSVGDSADQRAELSAKAASLASAIRSVRRRIWMYLFAAIVSGAVIGSLMAGIGLVLYHRAVITSGVADVVIPWSVLDETLQKAEFERNVPLLGKISVNGMSIAHRVGLSLRVDGRLDCTPTIGKRVSLPFSLEGIPVLKEKEVYLAAIHTSVGSGSGTLHAGFERLAQDLLGAWTSDHPVGKIPQQVVLDEAGIVRMSGRSDGFVITMRKSDAN